MSVVMIMLSHACVVQVTRASIKNVNHVTNRLMPLRSFFSLYKSETNNFCSPMTNKQSPKNKKSSTVL